MVTSPTLQKTNQRIYGRTVYVMTINWLISLEESQSVVQKTRSKRRTLDKRLLYIQRVSVCVPHLDIGEGGVPPPRFAKQISSSSAVEPANANVKSSVI